MTTELPTHVQRKLLGELLQRVLVEIRQLCSEGRNGQAGDLADKMHNLPAEMYGWGGFSWSWTIDDARSYEEKWRASDSPPMANYAELLRRIWDYDSVKDAASLEIEGRILAVPSLTFFR